MRRFWTRYRTDERDIDQKSQNAFIEHFKASLAAEIDRSMHLRGKIESLCATCSELGLRPVRIRLKSDQYRLLLKTCASPIPPGVSPRYNNMPIIVTD